MAFTDFDFGGDMGFDDGGFSDEGFMDEWWDEQDPFAGEFLNGDGEQGFGDMTPEQAREAIMQAMESQAPELPTDVGLEDVDATIGQGTIAEPTPGVPSELTPNDRVQDAFFDVAGGVLYDGTGAPDAASALRDAYQSLQQTQNAFQTAAQQRAGELGPVPPAPPSGPGPQQSAQQTIQDAFSPFTFPTTPQQPTSTPGGLPLPAPQPANVPMPLPRPAGAPGTMPIVSDQDRLVAAFDALQGQQIPTAAPGQTIIERLASGLPAYTSMPEQAPIPFPEQLTDPDLNPFGGTVLPPISVETPAPAPSDAEPTEAMPTRPGTGQGTTDVGIPPSESLTDQSRPSEAVPREDRLDQVGRARQQQQQQPSSTPPVPPEGRRSGIDIPTYPLGEINVPPQSVLRTDLRPEAERVRQDVQRALDAAPGPQGQGPVVRPRLPQDTVADILRSGAQAVPGLARDVAGAVRSEGDLLGGLIGDVFESTEGGGRPQAERDRSMQAALGLLMGGGIGPLGRTLGQRSLNAALATPSILFPSKSFEAAGGIAQAVGGLPGAIKGGLGRIPADELMEVFTGLPSQVARLGDLGFATPAQAESRQNARRRRIDALNRAYREGYMVDPVTGHDLSDPQGYQIPSTALEEMIAQGMNYDPVTGEAWPMGAPPVTADDPQRVDLTPVVSTTNVNTSDLSTLAAGAAGISAALIGIPYAGRFAAYIKNQVFPRLPTGRAVTDAPYGTAAFSRPGDLARHFDDPVAANIRTLEGMGVPYIAAKAVQKIGEYQTRGAAKTLASNAIADGHARSVTFNFDVDTPLQTVLRQATPEFTQYMRARSTYEEIQYESWRALQHGRPAGPIPIIRDQDMQQAYQTYRALERANPHFVDWAHTYANNLRETRRFMSDGEFATMPHALAVELNQRMPHWVPPVGHRPQTGQQFEGGSAAGALEAYMQKQLTYRMENEYRGTYIDTARRTQPASFTGGVTHAEAAAHHRRNSRHEPQSLAIMRRGEEQVFWTDPYLAASLKIDPYSLNPFESVIYGANRMFQATTTGALAPGFAVTGFFRNHYLTATSAQGEERAPWLFQSAAAIPQQLYPQAALHVQRMLEGNPNGWWTKILNPAQIQSLSDTMGRAYLNSTWHALSQHGGTASNIMMHQLENAVLSFRRPPPMSPIAHEGDRMNVTTAIHDTWEMYKSFLESMHNAAGFAFAKRNAPRLGAEEAALRGRQITGDTRVVGQYRTSEGAIPFQWEGLPWMQRQLQGPIEGLGIASEMGRVAIPWYNTTIQGMKAVGDKWMNEPINFTARMWLYGTMPGMASYLMAKGMGNDPQGRPYTDHIVNGRTDYASTMRMYIPPFWNGGTVDKGMEVPMIFHEAAVAHRLGIVALDHMFRSGHFPEKGPFMQAALNLMSGWLPQPASEQMSESLANVTARNPIPTTVSLSDDASRSVKNWLETVFSPAWPASVNAILGSFGYRGSQGPFSGDIYRVRVEPYDRQSPFHPNVELAARALGGNIADIIGAGAVGFTSTKGSALEAAGNAVSEAVRRQVQKTPIVSTVLGIDAPLSGTTTVSSSLYDKHREAQGIVRHYERAGAVRSLTPQSSRGQRILETELGAAHPMFDRPQLQLEGARSNVVATPSVGLPRQEATNPLYKEFISDLRRTIKSDEDAYLTTWRMRGAMTREINEMKRINGANAAAWAEYMDKTPGMSEWLTKHKVDPKNYNQVLNFHIQQRNDLDKLLLQKLQRFEDRMSEKAGRRITIGDLVPFRGYEDPERGSDPQDE